MVRAVYSSCLVFFAGMHLMVYSLQTEIAICLFDNGDKNMIASMLRYAQATNASFLSQQKFTIILFGAALEAKEQEPFIRMRPYIHSYKEFGITETIDTSWERAKTISAASIAAFKKNLGISKKIITGVSCAVFGQLLQAYSDQCTTYALRDNPSYDGDTDYFVVARQVQAQAQVILVPATTSLDELAPGQIKKIVGHGPIEEWAMAVRSLSRVGLCNRLALDAAQPIITIVGAYGDWYEAKYKQALAVVDLYCEQTPTQVLIAPHPRYKGAVEQRLMAASGNNTSWRIVGDWLTKDTVRASTLEAVALADVIVVVDPTSTVVYQACAAGKKVVFVTDYITPIARFNCDHCFLSIATNATEFAQCMHNDTAQSSRAQGALPSNGAQLLWEVISITTC